MYYKLILTIQLIIFSSVSFGLNSICTKLINPITTTKINILTGAKKNQQTLMQLEEALTSNHPSKNFIVTPKPIGITPNEHQQITARYAEQNPLPNVQDVISKMLLFSKVHKKPNTKQRIRLAKSYNKGSKFDRLSIFAEVSPKSFAGVYDGVIFNSNGKISANAIVESAHYYNFGKVLVYAIDKAIRGSYWNYYWSKLHKYVSLEYRENVFNAAKLFGVRKDRSDPVERKTQIIFRINLDPEKPKSEQLQQLRETFIQVGEAVQLKKQLLLIDGIKFDDYISSIIFFVKINEEIKRFEIPTNLNQT